MRLRYKSSELVTGGSTFNPHGMCEINTHDDSVSVVDLDVEIGGVWVDMREAFRRGLLITDNHNTRFFEPTNEEDKNRGYTL